MLAPQTLQNSTRMTYCPLCKGDAEEVVVGEVLRYTGSDGELFGYGHPGGMLAHELINQDIKYTVAPLEDHEKAPGSHPCPDCSVGILMQHKEFEREVILGGVHWFCVQCQKNGVVVVNDSQGFCANVRQASGIQPPNSLTVRFTDCRQHASAEDPLTSAIH